MRQIIERESGDRDWYLMGLVSEGFVRVSEWLSGHFQGVVVLSWGGAYCLRDVLGRCKESRECENVWADAGAGLVMVRA